MSLEQLVTDFSYPAVAVGVAGYLLGHTLELVLDELKHDELWILAALAGIGLTAWALRRWRGARDAARGDGIHP